MLKIGEKLNSSIPKIQELMKDKNTAAIKQLAIDQEKAGADFMDINTAVFRTEEYDMLKYVLDIVIENTKCGIMLDSTSPKVIEEAVKLVNDNRQVIINSITLQERLNELLPVVKGYNTGVVGLPIDKEGVPKTAQKRLDNSLKLINILHDAGIDKKKIYIDVLAEALAVDNQATATTLKTISELRKADNEVHLICGVSNVSFGLPKRANINTAFLITAVFEGLDSAILDITNDQIQSALYLAGLISGKDEYCMEYLNYVRNKK